MGLATDTAPRKRGRPPRNPGADVLDPPAAAGTVGDLLRNAAASATAPAKPKAGRPSTAATSRTALAKQLTDMYRSSGAMLMGAGLLVAVVPSAADGIGRASAIGLAMIENAEACGNALAAWAETNPAVAKALSRLGQGGGLAMVLMAHAPIVLAGIQKPGAPDPGKMFSALGNLVPDLSGLAGTPTVTEAAAA